MVLEAIRDRRSIRSFQARPVKRALVDQLLEAARLAPSAVNLQPFRALVVSEQGDLDVCRSAAYGIGACASAPLIIICVADLDAISDIDQRIRELRDAGALETVDYSSLRSGAGRPFEYRLGVDIAVVNAAVAAEHIVIEATALGLGSCWVHHFDEQQLRDAFGLEGDLELLAMLAIGWPNESPAPRPRIASVELNPRDRH